MQDERALEVMNAPETVAALRRLPGELTGPEIYLIWHLMGAVAREAGLTHSQMIDLTQRYIDRFGPSDRRLMVAYAEARQPYTGVPH